MPPSFKAVAWRAHTLRDIAVVFLLAAGCEAPSKGVGTFEVRLPPVPDRSTDSTLVFELFFTPEDRSCTELEAMVEAPYPNPPVELALRDTIATRKWPDSIPVQMLVPAGGPPRHVPWRVFGAVFLSGLNHATFCSLQVPGEQLDAEVVVRLLGTRPGRSMVVPRSGHTATVLPDGGVFVLGGYGAAAPAPSEHWSAGSGFVSLQPTRLPRAAHAATLLDDGRVLVSGGLATAESVATARTELVDPSTGATVLAASMGIPRDLHTAVLLANGKVLVTGGVSSGESHASTELYDPDAGTWRPGPVMRARRTFHTATMLGDGRVLIAGGFRVSDGGVAVTELYDPATDRLTLGPEELTPRNGHVAVLLLDGRVLLAGGASKAELFDPATDTLVPTGAPSPTPSFICAARASDGSVVLIGSDQRAHRYQPASNTWVAQVALSRPRRSCAAWALPGGEVMVSGGVGVGPAGASAASATSEVVLP